MRTLLKNAKYAAIAYSHKTNMPNYYYYYYYIADLLLSLKSYYCYAVTLVTSSS